MAIILPVFNDLNTRSLQTNTESQGPIQCYARAHSHKEKMA